VGLTREEPTGASRRGGRGRRSAAGQAARKRAAVEMIARHEQALRQTARRYSLCADDADDAYQRMLEILLVKAPTDRGRDLVAWAQTVTKHEALAIRHNRERLLGGPPGGGEHALDLVALIPAVADGPQERAERREAIARSREALQALKPAELQALTLLAEGYSYVEIGELTGFSQTKINRCLAEGRERFRELLSHGEDGRRCEEMRPLLSAFCDGEASAGDEAALREHLRACAACRSTLRAYRATPGAVAALTPGLSLLGPLLKRAHAMLSGLRARLPGGGHAAGSAGTPVAAAGAPGAPGAGMAALAKVVAVCVGAGAAAAVATGVGPLPFGLDADQAGAPAIERASTPVPDQGPAATHAGEAPAPPKAKARQPAPRPKAEAPESPEPEAQEPALREAETGPVEDTAPPAPPEPVPSAEPAAPSSGGAAGEFGP
jgi:RNA polymerase sigma factor (sigma-70 family)